MAINRIVVEINAVGNGCCYLAVDDGLLVARNNLGIGDIMSAFHHASSDTGCIDRGRPGADKEQPDEKACLFGTANKVQLVVGREDGLEYHALPAV